MWLHIKHIICINVYLNIYLWSLPGFQFNSLRFSSTSFISFSFTVWMFLILFFYYICMTQGLFSHWTEQIFNWIQAFASNTQVGQELIRSTTYWSPSFIVGPWARICSGNKAPPYGHYIAAIEQACVNMELHNAEEHRAEIRGTLKQTHPQEKNQ